MGDKPEHYYRQSAVIPYMWRDGHLKVVLITTQKKKKWTLPKGIVEPGLSPAGSAVKEAFEEAGIEGEVDPELFSWFDYDKWGGTCRVQVFLMEVTGMLKNWPEQEQRERELFDACDAHAMVGREEIKPVLLKFYRQRYNLPQ